VAFGNSDSARVGEWVLAIGNPLGEAFAFTVTAGIVSARGGCSRVFSERYDRPDFIQDATRPSIPATQGGLS